jgi:hypothetical protein
MKKPNSLTPRTMKTLLIGLAIECSEGGNPETCQLHEFRKKPFSEKNEFIKSLADEEVIEIYTNHLE